MQFWQERRMRGKSCSLDSGPPTIISAPAHQSQICSVVGYPTVHPKLYITLIQPRLLPLLLRSRHAPIRHVGWALLTGKQLAPVHIAAVQQLTRDIPASAYDPSIWSDRAIHLLALGFPELAAGDAYKSILLCHYHKGLVPQSARSQHSVEPVPPLDPDRHRLHLDAAYRSLIQALYDCHCYPECLHICQQAESRFPDEPYFAKAAEELLAATKHKADQIAKDGQSAVVQKDRLFDGAVLTIHYPWMQTFHRRRSQTIINEVNEEFYFNFGTCRLEKSSIPRSQTVTHARITPQFLGVFATRDLEPRECILIDRTSTGACSTDMGCEDCFGKLMANANFTALCCNDTFCSEDCYRRAWRTYHKAVCCVDFSWLLLPAKGLVESGAAMRPLLMCRYLSACVQNGEEEHPLDHSLIARLQSQTNEGHLDVFTFEETIVKPIQILQHLGVDVYANPNFDTWVIHTIWTRLANNKQAYRRVPQGWIESVSPLLPFFNHSCEPNIECVNDGSSTVRVHTRRRIKKGEELFDSYIDVESMPVERRQDALRPLFGGPCRCVKCLRQGSHEASERHATASGSHR